MISFRPEPVEADRVPQNLKGLRTLFNVFHHFDPGIARKALADAILNHQGIGIFEFVERSWVWWAALPFFPLFVWVVTPFLRPFRLARLLWTYLLPVAPLFVMIDGLMSCLRSYSVDELKGLAASTGGEFDWDCGRLPSFGGSRLTYLIGRPNPPGGLKNHAKSGFFIACNTSPNWLQCEHGASGQNNKSHQPARPAL
ncbi:MAG: hypothetical protein QME74_03650 [Candidatus Edwardsbacteria bacterium]|nr:hypothetical protein [Candidatus Edwardsbacteria bacterium]